MSDSAHVAVRNQDGTRSAAVIRQEPSTAAGASALDVANDDATGTVIHGKGAGGPLLVLHNGSTVKLKADANGNLVTVGTIALPAGTATAAPLTLPSGTVLTAAAAGAVENDGTALYFTAAASSRQVVDCEQIQTLTTANTLANDTSVHPIFNATTNGALTVAAATTYLFEMVIIGSGFSSSAHTLSLSFAGTATYTAVGYLAQTSVAAGGAISQFSSAVATATAVTASTTSTLLNAVVKGVMLINAAGTVIPSITQGTASAAASVGVQSYFRCWPVGSNTVTSVGDWS